MRRTFLALEAFSSVVRHLRLPDEHIRLLEREIMEGKGEVIIGTGGLRKIRCALPGRGKSGGIRVVFADYPAAGRCYLVAAFAKSVKENLNALERKTLRDIKAAMDRAIFDN